MQACWPSATICDGNGGGTRIAEKAGRKSARDGQKQLADSAISADTGQLGGNKPKDAQDSPPNQQAPEITSSTQGDVGGLGDLGDLGGIVDLGLEILEAL